MKTQSEIEKMVVDIEDKIQWVDSMLEKVSTKPEFIRCHEKRRQLKAQYNILLEVLR